MLRQRYERAFRNREVSVIRKTLFAPYAFISAVLTVTLLSALACNSASSKSSAETTLRDTQQKALPPTNGTGPGIDLNCVMNHLQNPPESFHYSFQDDSSNRWQEEATVTPQMITGSFMNNSLPKPQEFHGTPHEVWSNLMAIGRMASLLALVRNTSAVVNMGADKGVNGYDTIKYSIDTGRANQTEQALYTDVLGKDGFAKGTVWVIAQGCPVQLALDEELHSKDGSLVGKAHYEEAMVKR